MGYKYVEQFDVETKEESICQIGYRDNGEFIKIYAGDCLYPNVFTWGDMKDVKIRDYNAIIDEALKNKLDFETDKAISYVVSRRIIKRRKQKGLTKQAVANALGVTLGAYNAYELAYIKVQDGTHSPEVNYEYLDRKVAFRVPPVPKLIQLAKLFDCSIEWLIGVSDDGKKKFSDYNTPPVVEAGHIDFEKTITEPASNVTTLTPQGNFFLDSFNRNFEGLTATQQGILYGKLCEMLMENGAEMK